MSRLGLSSTELAARMRDVVRAPLRVDGTGGLGLDPACVKWPLRLAPDGCLESAIPRPRKATAAVSANYGDMILADPTAGAFAVQFPSARDRPGGSIIIKNRSASTNAITATARTGELIDDANTLVMSAAWSSRVFYADGERWLVI